MDTSQFGNNSNSLDRAWQLYRFHKYKAALEATMEFLGKHPRSSGGHSLLALIHTEENRQKEAFEAATHAIGLMPDDAYAHYVDGFVSFRFDKPYRAEKSVKEALRLDTTHLGYYALLADLQNSRKEYYRAIKTANQGLKLDANHPGCLYQRGISYWNLENKKEAEAMFRDVLRVDYDHSRAQGFMGILETERGNYQEGLSLLRNCLKENPNWTMMQECWKEAIKKHYSWYRVPSWVAEKLFKWPLFILYLYFPTTIFMFQAFKNNSKDWVTAFSLSLFVAFVVCFVLLILLRLYVKVASDLLLLVNQDLKRTWTWKTAWPKVALAAFVVAMFIYVNLVKPPKLEHVQPTIPVAPADLLKQSGMNE